MHKEIIADSGSFRDPCGRVYLHQDVAVYRGVDKATATHLDQLLQQSFFKQFVRNQSIVSTERVDSGDLMQKIQSEGWYGVFSSERIPFISYPYEWSFQMLQDAALLHLNLLEKAIDNNWMLKDATPYNIQFVGAKPVFIDIASFVSAPAGTPWKAYRQFCMMFLYPLLVHAHLGIDFRRLLRADLDGITPVEAAAFFNGVKCLKKGVLAHVIFPASVEKSITQKERNKAPVQKRSYTLQSSARVLGIIDGLKRLITGLKSPLQTSDWSEYADTHSYDDKNIQEKYRFIEQVAGQHRRSLVWDLGANTGTFAKLCATQADTVIAADSDVESVEKLYITQRNLIKLNDKNLPTNITPLVLNIANISPNHGFGGDERKAFDCRQKPQLVLCLALVHHLRIGANIPMPLFLDWLCRLGSEVVIEFVGREDEMTQKLLFNKEEQYEDYNDDDFLLALKARFDIIEQHALKEGKRTLYHVKPQQ